MTDPATERFPLLTIDWEMRKMVFYFQERENESLYQRLYKIGLVILGKVSLSNVIFSLFVCFPVLKQSLFINGPDYKHNHGR